MDFWAKTSGTWINILTVIIGTSLGLLFKSRFNQKTQLIVTQGLGLVTLTIGTRMAGSLNHAKAGSVDGIILAVITIILGGILGEYWQLEERLNNLGNWLKARFRGKGSFSEGFVAASLLFCVGPMAIIGSLNNGITGDITLLGLKAAMDGIASIALTTTYGIGVGFSTILILLYQGAISLAAGQLTTILPNPASDPRIFLITGVGGLMILGMGLNILEIGHIRIASFLPALALAPFIYWLVNTIIN